VDESGFDRAHVFFAPRAVVEGVNRDTDVLVFRGECFDAAALAESAPEIESRGDGHGAEHSPVVTQSDKIPKGFRHRALLTMAGKLRRAGLGGDAMAAALRVFSASRFEEPLPDTEVDRVAHDIGSKPTEAQDNPARSVLEDAARRLADLSKDTSVSPFGALGVARKLLDAIAGEVAPPRVWPWRTVSEVLAAAKEKPREWLLPRVLYFAAVAFLIGGPKASGKTTLALAVIGSALVGKDLFGRPLAGGCVGAALLTEEADQDLADKLTAFAVSGDAKLSVLSRVTLTPRPSWEESIREATRRCIETGARILAIDTFYRWAMFAGDDGNKSSAVLRALDALDEAKTAGLLVLLLHHPSKGAAAAGIEGGAAGLGSVSAPGETEVNLELRSARDKANPNRRILHVESRTSGVFDLLLSFERGDPSRGTMDRYMEVGDLKEVAHAEADTRVLGFIQKNPGATNKDIEGRSGVRAVEARASIPRLLAKGKAVRRGKGKAGSPYRHYTPEAAPPDDLFSDQKPGNGSAPSRSVPTASGETGEQAVGSSPSAPSASVKGQRRDGRRETEHGRRKSRRAKGDPVRDGVMTSRASGAEG